MRITPDNFYANPLGYGGNQAGHIALGIVACYWFAWIWKYFAGELPLAILCAAVWAGVYLSIELSQKGAKLWDTVEDIAVSIGYPTAFVLFSRDAFAAVPELFDDLLPVFGLATAHLLTGGGVRFWQAHKEGRDL